MAYYYWIGDLEKMAGTSRRQFESFYGELSGNIGSQWGEDAMATLDDKLHMSEQTAVQTVVGPINFTKTGSMYTFASPLNVTPTGVNTFGGPINATSNAVNTFGGPFNATSTGVNTWAGPMDFNDTINVQGIATFQTAAIFGSTVTFTGAIDANSTVNIEGIATFQTGASFGSTVTFTGSMDINGNVVFGGITTFDAMVYYGGGTTYFVSSGAAAKLASLVLPSGSTVTEFSTDTTMGGSSNSAVPTEGATKEYIDNRTLSTDSHQEWLPCVFHIEQTAGNLEGRADGIVTIAIYTDPTHWWRLPFATNRGGKTLRISGIRVGINTANSNNYMSGYDIHGDLYSGGTSLKTVTGLTVNAAARYENLFTAVDAGSYDVVGATITLVMDTNHAFKIAFINLRCHYE